MRLWPRKRYGVFAFDQDHGILIGPVVYRYVRFKAAANMAAHLTTLASVRHPTQQKRPPLKYVVRSLDPK